MNKKSSKPIITVDDKLKLVDIKLRRAQVSDLPLRLKLDEDKLFTDRQKADLDKIVQIGRLLEAFTIESKDGIDVVKYSKVFDEQEEKRLKLKLFQLLRKI